jgi:hypothetical protein
MIFGTMGLDFLKDRLILGQLKHDVGFPSGLDHAEKHFAVFLDDIFSVLYPASRFGEELR